MKIKNLVICKFQQSIADKQMFSCFKICIIIIFFLALISIGILSFNFIITSVNEEIIDNIRILPWIWNYESSKLLTFEFLKNNLEHFIVCYYTIKDNNSKLMPKNLDPYLCTHIIIGFASVVNCSIDLGNELTIYHQIVELKTIHSNLKVMVSVGGSNESSFTDMVINHNNRKKFIRSVLNITKTYNLDGLDLDWEFPAWATKAGHEKIHFARLIYELRKEFDHSGQTLILSAAVASVQAIIDQSYEVQFLAKYIDFINLMSYDYHFYVWYYPVTDLNSPLYPYSSEGYLASLNVNFSANYWILKGMPREKIVVGIPLYGHTYKLYNCLNHKIQAPASGYGDTGYLGFVSYPQVCDFLKNGAVRVFVNSSCVPYAYKNNEWISYDDISSVSYKAKWIKLNGFKGSMVYSLNMDDWNATCTKNSRFPLINTIKNVFISKSKVL